MKTRLESADTAQMTLEMENIKTCVRKVQSTG